MPEQTVGSPNGASNSRIFSPDRGTAPARPTPPDAAATEPAIERDPVSGRFLKPGFPGHLVAKARRLGLTDDDLRDIDDPRELRDLVRERDFEARISQVFDPKAVAAALKAQDRPIEQPTARPPLDLGLNDEEDNPRLIEALTKMRDHYEDRIETLEKRLAGTEGKVNGREAQEGQSFARRVEKCFAKHADVFGEGPIDKLDQTSAEFHFRMAAVSAHRAAGGLPEDLEENINAFVASKFGGRKRAAHPGTDDDADDLDDGDEAEQWQRGVLARPTQAGAREAPPGREKATQNVRSRLSGLNQGRDAKQPRGIYLNSSRNRANGPER